MASKARRVVASPVVTSNKVSTKTEGLEFSKTEKWGSDNDGNSHTTSIKCCGPLNKAYAKLLTQLVEDALREPQDEPFQSNAEVFYNGGINHFEPLPLFEGVTAACDDLCQNGISPNFIALAKAKFYNLTQISRDPALFGGRAQLEYQAFLLNLVAIARAAFLQIQEENCVRNVCCDALAKQIVSAMLAANRLVRDAILFSPLSYGFTVGIDDTNGAASPASQRGYAVVLQYNQLTTNLNAAFKIAGCTGFCPPDRADLPAQIPSDFPNVNGTGYPYTPAPHVLGDVYGPALSPALLQYPGENNCA